MRKRGLTVSEITLFAVLGAIVFATKVAMAALPNIHLVAVLIIAYTVVYRGKALIPLFIYVLLEGLMYGFGQWWVPYLYVWPLLWGAAMLVPRKFPKWLRGLLYCLVGLLHGLLFGTLWAPAQALFFGLNFKGMVAWIVAGLPYDVTHGISNLILCSLVVPITELLKYLNSRMGIPS